MDPKMIGVVVLVVFQFLGALTVMRAGAASGLTGLGRLVPVILALFVPVLGPFVASRSTGSGMRPVLISLVGAVVGGGLFVVGAPRQAPPLGATVAQQPAEGQPAEGQPAEGQPVPEDATPAPEGATPAPEGATPAPEGATPAPEGATPAEPPAGVTPEPVAQPAPAPAPQPTAPTAAPVEVTSVPTSPTPAPPAPVSATLVGAEPAPVEGAATGIAAVYETLNPGAEFQLAARNIKMRGQITLPGPHGQGGYINYWLDRSPYANRRLLIGAGVTTPPNQASFMEPQLYLGGKVLWFNELEDAWEPLALPVLSVSRGQRITLPSNRGGYVADFVFSELTKSDDERTILSAVLDVKVW